MNKTVLPKKSEHQKSFLLWGTILGLTVLWIGIIIIPQTLTDLEQQQALHTFEQQENTLNDEIIQLETTLSNQQAQFQKKASKFIKSEEQLLPPKLEIEQISKSLEVYSLVNQSFNLSSLSFGTTKMDTDINVAVLPVNIEFTASEKEARQFIQYLQTNVLPLGLGNQSEIALRKFIKSHPVPLCTIQTIDFTTLQKDNRTVSNQKKVTLNVNFYGQPLPKETQKK
ncbi:hypothetical protein CSB37_02420 [bacterium DOLZORAL124_38_8]|nr:MAG: hypothetical protein CSB37_02420 [bacterium DOLZORAL124_38_8]